MESEDSGPGATNEAGVNQSDQIARLNAWTKERPLTVYFQRQARKNIAKAITIDLLHPLGTLNIPPKVDDYRRHVDTAVALTINRLVQLPVPTESGVVKVSPYQTDKYTGITFLTQIRREADSWVSEEIDEQASVISQARLQDNSDNFELTLDFSHLENQAANPGIKHQKAYPTGTKVLFLNHAASLVIIGWQGK